LAGIYIHIPFCRKACHYCNFHFSTTLHQKNELHGALLEELKLRAAPQGERIDTVYLGGGTPSLFSPGMLDELLQAAHRYFPVASQAEITLEANPDDIVPENLDAWKSIGINRLSLGIQSFRTEDLRWMNRSHDAIQALNSLDLIDRAGYTNYSADLIFGIPGLDDKSWQSHILMLAKRRVPHISAYALTVEPRTALDTMIRQGKTISPDPDQQARQFLLLMDILGREGYEHYEISNFALPGMRSRHNSSYWSGTSYLGIGPSAHSFDGRTRSWNIAQNAGYIRSLAQGQLPYEAELLSPDQQRNEYVMTRLRTIEGIDLSFLAQQWGDASRQALMVQSAKHVRSQHAVLQGNHLQLSREGKLFADRIAADLFV
jgi:oxygen-independent coproporphyrinogen-3 oxidase